MKLNLDRVRQNVRKADTEDLLDRATVYRSEIEAAALAIIDAELVNRNVTIEQIEAHCVARQETLSRDDGTTIKCSFCYRPAISSKWGWHRLFGILPIFRRRISWCAVHLDSR